MDDKIWITTKQGNHICISNDLTKAIEEYYKDYKHMPTLKLPYQEYRVIQENILYDDKVLKKYKGKKICTYYSGNAFNQSDKPYMYIFVKNRSEYRIIDKIDLLKYTYLIALYGEV